MLNNDNIKDILQTTFNEVKHKKNILLRYTQKLDFKPNIQSNNKSQSFRIVYPNSITYVGFDICKEYKLYSNSDFIKLKKLSYTIKSFGDKDTNDTIKLFGGMSFDMGKLAKYPWENIPKGTFFIPEFLIKKINDQHYLSFYHFIDKKSNINNIQDKYQLFINILKEKTKSNNSIITFKKNIPSKEKYFKLFTNYQKKIDSKIIEKSVLARMKIFSSNQKISLKNNKLKCTNFNFNLLDNIHFIGSTPELLIEINNLEFKSDALAGTYNKNSKLDSSIIINNFLKNKKELSEHQYVIDYLMNIFKRYSCEISFDSNPKILELEHFYHLHTQIKGQFNKKNHIIDLATNLHPTPAILGTPSKKSKEIILKNEPFDRGWYSGYIGWFDLNGNGRFDVSIRSALQNNNTLFCFAGSGIIDGSTKYNEWEETESKFQHLLSLIK